MRNKKFQFLALAVLVFLPVAVSAQIFAGSNSTDYSKTPSIGFKVGANLSNVYDTKGEEFEADAKIGFATGAFITIPLTSIIGVQPEILFSQKGYQGSGSVLGSEYSFKRTTNYIDVPLLLTITPIQPLTIVFGPQYSFLLSQSYKFKSDFIDITQEEQFENENLRKNTLGLTGGFDVNISKIVLSARAGWDMLSNDGDGTSNTPRYKNMWYQLTVGFRL
jgi:hypothetical protein